MENADAHPPDEPVTVRTLGGFSIRHGGQELDSLPPRAASLLAYLILHRDRAQTRDLLAGRFWSDLPDDRARRRLSNCLWQVRVVATEAGMPDLFASSSSAVKLDPTVTFSVDVEEFERRLDGLEPDLGERRVASMLVDRLSEVVDLYTGDLLAGHYHDWIDQERERVRVRYQAAVTALIDLYKGRSDYERALHHAKALVVQSPLSEELHQEVMRIYALLGQTNAAERQFEACRQVLREELRIEPSAGTMELLERIRNDAPRCPPRSSYANQSSAIVGRHHELAVLIGRAEELLGGRGGVVLVEGDPGIGKTRLIDEFVSAADWRSLRVMRVGHSELSRTSPYDSLKQLLAEATFGLRGEHLAEVLEPVWLRQAADVLPNLAEYVPATAGYRSSLRPDEESSRTGEALVRTLLAQGDLGPTVVVLDDVHWCDDDTMEVLASAGARLAASGVLLCLSYRRFEAEQADVVWSGITALEALPASSRLELGPLSAAEVHELAANRLGPGEVPMLDNAKLVEVTKGNPLYVVEALRDPSMLVHDEHEEGAGDIGPLSLPDAVASSLRSRLASLPEPSRRVLNTLAVLAEPASVGLVSSVAQMGRLPVVEALTRMADQGLIEEVNSSCRFGHEQTRQAVYGLMDADDRSASHGRVFEVLAEQETDRPDRLGYHARLAGRMGAARDCYLDAGYRALAVNGYRTAAEHFGQSDQAAQEAGIKLRDRARDLLAYEQVLDVLGRRDEQAMYLKSLREVDLDPLVEMELSRREILLLVKTEDLAKAIHLGEKALDQAERSGLAVHGILVALAAAKRHSGDLGSVVALARRALANPPDLAAEVEAETVLGKALVDQADYELGCDHLRRAIEGADRLGDTRAKVEALGALATAQASAGSSEEAGPNFELALSLSRDIGFRWGEGVNLLNLAALHTWRGRGGVALGLYDEARCALGSVRDARGEAFINLNQAMLWLWVIGDVGVALDMANSAAVYFRSAGDELNECWALAVVAAADLHRGKRRMVRGRIRDLLPRVRREGFAVAEVQIRRVHAQLLEANGDRPAARAELEGILDLCSRYGLAAHVPFVASWASLHALELGEPAAAERLARRAKDGLMDGADLAHVASWVCATVLDRLGHADEATSHFRAARELLDMNLEGLPAELAEHGRSNVEVHRQLLADYERRFEITKAMLLPSLAAPTGRSLRPDESVPVTVHVNLPSDWEQVTERDRRHVRVVRLAEEAAAQGAAIRVVDLAQALGVSDRTIKRDLAELRAKGRKISTRRG